MTGFNTSVLMGAGAGLLCLAFGALAQTAANVVEPAPQANAVQPASPQPASPPASASACRSSGCRSATRLGDAEPELQAGFIDAFGRWLQDGREKFDSQVKGAKEALGEFHDKARDNAKEAAGALTGASRVVNGHARCEVAQNGAPDCAVAANSVCLGKGFKTGKSVATQTEEKCPARVLLSGRSPSAGECKTETFVTRAVCQ